MKTLLKEIFGDVSSHEVYGDLKKLHDDVSPLSDASFYTHIIEKMK